MENSKHAKCYSKKKRLRTNALGEQKGIGTIYQFSIKVFQIMTTICFIIHLLLYLNRGTTNGSSNYDHRSASATYMTFLAPHEIIFAAPANTNKHSTESYIRLRCSSYNSEVNRKNESYQSHRKLFIDFIYCIIYIQRSAIFFAILRHERELQNGVQIVKTIEAKFCVTIL